MNIRLQQFLAAENITQAQFADKINVARASISHIIAGRNNPGYDFIVGVMKSFPELNIEWLLTGTGKMYKSQQQSTNVGSNDGTADLFAPQTLTDDAEKIIGNSNTGTDKVSGNEESARQPAVVRKYENPERQRKAVRVIVLYDDNSYQEL